MRLLRWMKPKVVKKKRAYVVLEKVTLDDKDGLFCRFCGQEYKFHPIDLPFYTARTICDGRHIRL